MTEPKLRVRGLCKIFGPDPRAALARVREGMGKAELLDATGHVLGLHDVDMDVAAGRITVVMGLSGSGKSTLVRHLNRLIEPTAGEIWLDGEDVLAYGPARLAALRQRRMSMVFQKFALFPHQTVLANAGLSRRVRGEGRAAADREGRRWVERVGLAGYEESYPGALSGGMQQRVGLARALASDSEIMLMDEAFSALDPLIRTDMQGLLLDLQRELEKTIVFITHDLDEALRLADHLVILKDGAVIQQGEPQDIILRPADGYIMDFIADINRARVLRVRSVMEATLRPGNGLAGEVEASQTLESVIALSEGDTNLHYRVMDGGRQVGLLHMRDLVRALVPVAASSPAARVA